MSIVLASEQNKDMPSLQGVAPSATDASEQPQSLAFHRGRVYARSDLSIFTSSEDLVQLRTAVLSAKVIQKQPPVVVSPIVRNK